MSVTMSGQLEKDPERPGKVMRERHVVYDLAYYEASQASSIRHGTRGPIDIKGQTHLM
jgi:hypothetical protein